MRRAKEMHRAYREAGESGSGEAWKLVNDALHPLEHRMTSDIRDPHGPVVFIVGLQRSGTTMLIQMLAQHTNAGYINNFMARFWKAPYLGAVLARDLRVHDDSRVGNYHSEFGYTKCLSGPHEFGYFWSHWFPGSDEKPLDSKQLEKVDDAGLRREIAALQRAFAGPLVFKNLIMVSFLIEYLAQHIPGSVFVHCIREAPFVCQSTLESRIRLYGSENEWFGLRPPEIDEIRTKDVAVQLVEQYYYCRRHIEHQLSTIADSRKTVLEYDEMCRQPEQALTRIADLIAWNGGRLELSGRHIPPQASNNQVRLDPQTFEKIDTLCRQYGLASRNA